MRGRCAHRPPTTARRKDKTPCAKRSQTSLNRECQRAACAHEHRFQAASHRLTAPHPRQSSIVNPLRHEVRRGPRPKDRDRFPATSHPVCVTTTANRRPSTTHALLTRALSGNEEACVAILDLFEQPVFAGMRRAAAIALVGFASSGGTWLTLRETGSPYPGTKAPRGSSTSARGPSTRSAREHTSRPTTRYSSRKR